MKYLITGGNGFIGSNAVKALLQLGHEVEVIDNLSSDAHDEFVFHEGAKYHKYHIEDYVMCSQVFEKFRPDYVLHFAALARIQNCVDDPILAYETNLIGTLNMLQLCVRNKVKKFVFSSTSAVYGLKNSPGEEAVPLNEDMVPDCLNAYSCSKLASEQACKMYTDLYGLPTICLRYFNVYGPNQPKKGSYAPVIGIFSRQKKNKEPMTIVGDGLQTRDYVHVSDVVIANILAATSDVYGEVFNVGSGKNYSVLELAKMMGGEYTYVPARAGEARHTLADISKIREYLGWNPAMNLLNYMENKIYDS